MLRRVPSLFLGPLLCAVVLVGGTGCGADGTWTRPPNGGVRARIEALAPAANLAHRGTGPTGSSSQLPENSIPAFLAGIAAGADGVELDVELTTDGRLIVMHDDTLDRTTDCTGCVSAFTLAELRQCSLLDAGSRATSEHPPTLEEVYQALPPEVLVNVELKVFDAPCRTAETGPTALARAVVEEVDRLGVEGRTLFSSFDEEAAAAVKEEDPQLYSALLLSGLSNDLINRALDLGLDAVHPFLFVVPASVSAALTAGLHVSVWTVNTPDRMNEFLDMGVTAIITDEPALLAEVLAARR